MEPEGGRGANGALSASAVRSAALRPGIEMTQNSAGVPVLVAGTESSHGQPHRGRFDASETNRWAAGRRQGWRMEGVRTDCLSANHAVWNLCDSQLKRVRGSRWFVRAISVLVSRRWITYAVQEDSYALSD